MPQGVNRSWIFQYTFPLTSLPPQAPQGSSVRVIPSLRSSTFGRFAPQRNSRLSIRGSQGNHTIFDGYVIAFRRHHSFVVVLARFSTLSTRNLRLLFRLVRTGIYASPSNRHTAAIRHHPPTRKRTDEHTVFQPVELAVILRPRAERIIRRLPMASALC